MLPDALACKIIFTSERQTFQSDIPRATFLAREAHERTAELLRQAFCQPMGSASVQDFVRHHRIIVTTPA